MREHLIGYLLGALEPEEHTEVEQALAQDPALQSDLQYMRRSLDVIGGERAEASSQHLMAPAGLATRTCERVAHEVQPVVTPASRMQPAEAGAPAARGWSLLDYAVAAGVIIAAGMLVLPAINQSRFHSRLIACQDNLRQVGQALDSYSEAYGKSFPAIQQGDVVGKYGVELVSRGLEPRNLVCPNSPRYDSQCWNKLPTKEQLANSGTTDRQKYLDAMQDVYGYTLGYLQNNEHRTRINEGDAHFALVADAPSKVGESLRSVNHGGCGQNVLFEDGHVRYVSDCRFGDIDNHFYTNAQGQVDLGTHPDDAVIVPANFVVPAPATK